MSGYLDREDDYRWMCKHLRSIIIRENNPQQLDGRYDAADRARLACERMSKYSNIAVYVQPIGPALCSLMDVLWDTCGVKPSHDCDTPVYAAVKLMERLLKWRYDISMITDPEQEY